MDRFYRVIGIVLLSLLPASALAQQPTTNSGPHARAKATKTNPKLEPVLDSSERFLFVVDTSSRMRKLNDASRQTVFDLIFFGVASYMTNGDSFGIWTFNEQAYAGQFPMQVWHSASNLPLASAAATFLKEQKYDGDARIAPLLTRLASMVRAVKDVNILIISDGHTPLEGTALDTALNTVYDQKRKEQKSVKKPFITTLVMRGGRLVQGDVVLPGEAIQLPPRVAKPVVAKAATPRPKPTAAKTNSFKGKAVAQLPPDPRTNFILKANPQPVKGSIVTLKTNIQAQTSGISNLVTASSATNAPITLAATTNAEPFIVDRATHNSPADPPPFSAFAAIPIAAREKPAATSPAVAPLVSATLAPPNPLLRPGGLVVIGTLLLLAALTMLYWGLRRFRAASTQPSFISRSMERR